MSRLLLTRRNILKALGASAALLPLLDSEIVRADPVSIPKRVLFIGWTNGYWMPDWRPRGTANSFTLGQTLAPLAPYQDKLLIVDGVGQKVDYDANASALGWGKDQWYGGHDGYPGLLTGVPPSVYSDNDEKSGGDSVDQYIATQLASQVKLPFPSLTVGPFASSGWYGTMSYKGASSGITAERDPFNLYKNLFAGLNVPPGQFDKAAAERKSILDYVGNDLTRFQKRLGTEDQAKVAIHLASIRALEQRLVGGSALQCTAPPLPASWDINNDVSNYPKTLTLFSDLLLAAFRCDLTRVATMTFTDLGGDFVLSWLGQDFSGPGDEFPQRTHHDITHNAGKDDTHTQRKIRSEQWFHEQVAYIVKQLAQTSEGTGTMLDNTLVVVTNSMGDNHDSHMIPFTLIGNLGGHFKTGQYLKVPTNTPHNGVLVAIANAMGVKGSAFGSPAYSAELPGMKA